MDPPWIVEIAPDGTITVVLTPLGPDHEALLARDAPGERFDLGLGRSTARFSIRCSPDLAAQRGAPLPERLELIRADVVAYSPVRIVETPCLRAEVDAPIPPPDGTSPESPHTHLLPDYVAQGFDAPPTLPLPKGYVLSVVFYPA